MRAASRLRRAVFATAAVVLGMLAALILCEVGLRVAGYAGADERLERRFDIRYGTVRKDSWIFDFAIDRRIHRAVELAGQVIPLDKPEGERRVLFLGDSATEGAFVPRDAAYPARFQRLLDQRNPDNAVRAINAGVWGMTTIDELHLLEDRLLPLKPDVVVLGLFMANDINFNLGHRERRADYSVPRLVNFLRQHSALGHFLFLTAQALGSRVRVLRAATTPRWVPVELTLIDARGFHMLSYPAGEAALYFRRPSALAERAFAVLESVLGQFRALGRARGFEPRVLLIPTPSAVEGHLRILHHPNIVAELASEGVTLDPDELDFALPTRRVLAICTRLSLPCVDATPRFRRIGRRAFFPADEHPTAAGHDALARALLDG